MNPFRIWASTGFQHILDPNGYDHILFVALLSLAFPPAHWRKLLILVTAFTLGHSVSLAGSVFWQWYLPQTLVEPGIALSILITAVYTFFKKESPEKKSDLTLYIITLGFGVLHGLGFSYLLRSLLGQEESVFLPLLYFNLGIELGQLLIVGILLGISVFLKSVFYLSYTPFKYTLICSIGLVALKLSIERLLPFF
ncbi:MAG: HupE/UreJ family protein [Bacteroidia bacterium]|jgi:hypothetical protein|nr:HupE/UreJ family protein [Bacteroidia bacterium]